MSVLRESPGYIRVECQLYGCYPTPNQRHMLAQTFGSVRFVYNWALALRRDAYREHGEHLFYQRDQLSAPAFRHGGESWVACTGMGHDGPKSCRFPA